MPETEILEIIEYKGKTIPCQMPLGIYLDGKITGRIHDFIIPKYHKINPYKLILLNEDSIKMVKKMQKDN